MLTSTRPCTCEGTNPDCCRCNGTGLLPLQTPKIKNHSEAFEIAAIIASTKKVYLPSDSNRKHANNSMSSEYEIVECPVCKINIYNKDIKDHVMALHKDYYAKKLKPVSNNNIIRDEEYIMCDVCRCIVRRTKIKDHRTKCLNIKKAAASNKKKKKTVVSATYGVNRHLNPKNSYAKCEKCDYLLPLTELENHRSTCNGIKSKNIGPAITKNKLNLGKVLLVKKKNQNSESVILQRRPSCSDITIETEAPPRTISNNDIITQQLDATYGKHTIRDSGRFGSHPSFDNFDDESMP
jgi:hypothetical protein